MQTKLWNKDFTLYWLGTAQATFGTSLAGVALSFLVLELTGSAASMGITLALALAPGLLSPLAGTLVDRIPLKLPLVAGDFVRGLLMLGVWMLAEGGQLHVAALYALALLSGLIGAIYQPAAASLIPTLVPAGELARANGLLGMATQSMRLIGLVAGGWMVGQIGSAGSLAVNGVSFLVMGVLLMFVRMPRRAAPAGRGFWQDFREGFQVVRASRVISLIMVLAFFINAAFAPLEMLLPVQMQRYGVGAQGYGMFMGLMTLGMLLGSGMVAALGARFRGQLGLALGLAGLGLSLVLLALTPSYLPSLIGSVLMGLSLGVTNTAVGLLAQTLVAPEFRGRVFGFVGAVAQIGMPLTLLLLASVADRLPISGIFWAAGLTTLATAAAWTLWGRERPGIVQPKTV
ncbi:DHA3 family macrolide efflux protein-like MFS transporter [Deinobacterium chartae]|uniref:DHA3 family macrolide efflux protein-like MFS transporter n=1 Tax=Deinobacterium chartae TaxID=521158 RepID=A0A841I2R7_9DEIO|nr:MFS transporter [Deinobacterium chartae]MBB6098669.1 DHA3 family macrolide efflux protein-like MFS transporter [Deinobacterium chartae]